MVGWGVRKRKRRSREARVLFRDQLGIGSAASSVRCDWSLCIVWGFHCIWLLLAEPTKHGGMCRWGWEKVALLWLAQLGLLSCYNPLPMLIIFNFRRISYLWHFFMDISVQCPEQRHSHTAKKNALAIYPFQPLQMFTQNQLQGIGIIACNLSIIKIMVRMP